MTNLEKFYGIKVHFKEILDPLELTYLRDRALKISRLKRFNIEDFSVYVHSMHVHINHTHFSGNHKLSEKIQELQVRFLVNPKQAKTGKIKFYNELARRKPMDGVNEAYEDSALIKYYSGNTLNNNNYFKTELITYIDKSLRRDSHKKIKVQIKPVPTPDYKEILTTRKKEILTSIDLKLIKSLQLKIHFATDEELKESERFLVCMNQLIALRTHLEKKKSDIFSNDLDIIKLAINNIQDKDEKSLQQILSRLSMEAFSAIDNLGLTVILKFAHNSQT